MCITTYNIFYIFHNEFVYLWSYIYNLSIHKKSILPESCRLENMADTRMHVRFISVILLSGLTQEGGQPLVHHNGLEAGNNPPPSGLEDVLVRPVRVHLTHKLSLKLKKKYLKQVQKLFIKGHYVTFHKKKLILIKNVTFCDLQWLLRS